MGLRSVRAIRLSGPRGGLSRHYGNYGVGLAPARRCGDLGCRACVYNVWSASPRVCRPLGRPLWPWRRRRQRGQLEGVAYVGAYSQKLLCTYSSRPVHSNQHPHSSQPLNATGCSINENYQQRILGTVRAPHSRKTHSTSGLIHEMRQLSTGPGSERQSRKFDVGE